MSPVGQENVTIVHAREASSLTGTWEQKVQGKKETHAM